jgi:hypothetical protein
VPNVNPNEITPWANRDSNALSLTKPHNKTGMTI